MIADAFLFLIWTRPLYICEKGFIPSKQTSFEKENTILLRVEYIILHR